MVTPKWIVFIFRNLCKFGEGGKMAKVLVILEAGNPACKVNSIKKPQAFSTQRVATTIYLFFIWQLFFGVVSAFENV